MSHQDTQAEDPDVDGPETELTEYWFSHFEAARVTASILWEYGSTEVRECEFDEQFLEISFHPDGVSVTVNGRNDDYSIDAGAMGVLDPEEAREVADAIYRAAEEVEARYGT